MTSEERTNDERDHTREDIIKFAETMTPIITHAQKEMILKGEIASKLAIDYPQELIINLVRGVVSELKLGHKVTIYSFWKLYTPVNTLNYILNFDWIE